MVLLCLIFYNYDCKTFILGPFLLCACKKKKDNVFLQFSIPVDDFTNNHESTALPEGTQVILTMLYHHLYVHNLTGLSRVFLFYYTA